MLLGRLFSKKEIDDEKGVWTLSHLLKKIIRIITCNASAHHWQRVETQVPSCNRKSLRVAHIRVERY